MGRLRTRLAGQDGVTLVELLVVTLLLGVVGSIVTAGVISAERVTRHTETRIQALTSLHHTVANISREIRAADSRFVNNTVLIAASPERLETVVLRDGKIFRFIYELADGDLTESRRVWDDPAADISSTPPGSQSTRVLATDVTNSAPVSLFGYRDRYGACLTGCDDANGSYLAGGLTGARLGAVNDVTLTLRRSVGADRSPIEVITKVALRNG